MSKAWAMKIKEVNEAFKEGKSVFGEYETNIRADERAKIVALIEGKQGRAKKSSEGFAHGYEYALDEILTAIREEPT